MMLRGKQWVISFLALAIAGWCSAAGQAQKSKSEPIPDWRLVAIYKDESYSPQMEARLLAFQSGGFFGMRMSSRPGFNKLRVGDGPPLKVVSVEARDLVLERDGKFYGVHLDERVSDALFSSRSAEDIAGLKLDQPAGIRAVGK